MSEFQQAFLAMTKEAMYAKNPLIISLNSYKNSSKSFCSLESKLFYDKQKDKIFIFTYNNDCIDCYDLLSQIKTLTNQNKQTLQEYDISIFFYSILLTGGTESTMPYSECFFGDLDSNDSQNSNADSNNDLDESKPIYYLECDESDLDSSESSKSYKTNSNSQKSNADSSNQNNNLDSSHSNNSTQANNKTKIYPTNQTLQIFLNNHRLTILNYSILDSSLNIKLECKSKESKAIQQNEQAQRDKAQIQSSTPSISTAFLCPILECDELKCAHGGQVKLTSNVGKTIKAKTKDDSSKDSPLVLESDLLYSPILNCPNNIAGIPSPCTQVALILPNARGLKKYNDDYPIMQDLCVSGVFSDKGFPIICTPKPNTLKIQSPKPSNNNAESREAKKPNITLTKPQLRLHYKSDRLQKDNLYIYNLILNDEMIESQTPLESLQINIEKDTKELDDKNLKPLLQNDYPKNYDFREMRLRLDSNEVHIIFVIPTKIPKIFKESYENYKYKKYGVGRFKRLYNYDNIVERNTKKKDFYHFLFITPAKVEKLDLQLAQGKDKTIDDIDTKNGEYVCKFVTVNEV